MLGVAAAIILVTAFFFLAAAIVVGAVLAAVLMARVWWLRRKMAKAAEREFISAEYRVVEREGELGGSLPRTSQGERHPDGHVSDAAPGTTQSGSAPVQAGTPGSGLPPPDENIPGRAPRQ